MSELSRRRAILGRAAHEHVETQYRSQHRSRWLIADTGLVCGKTEVSLGRGTSVFDRELNDWYLRVVKLVLQTRTDPVYPLQPPDRAVSRKPDLADFTTREVWEVKPATQGARRAVGQLNQFLALLRQADREFAAYLRQRPEFDSSQFRRDEPWHPGGPLTFDTLPDPAGVGGVITFDCPVPGVILWTHHASRR